MNQGSNKLINSDSVLYDDLMYLHPHSKDESKEPIVEVRTEDGLTANHDAGGHSEPNETTPLTEPE